MVYLNFLTLCTIGNTCILIRKKFITQNWLLPSFYRLFAGCRVRCGAVILFVFHVFFVTSNNATWNRKARITLSLVTTITNLGHSPCTFVLPSTPSRISLTQVEWRAMSWQYFLPSVLLSIRVIQWNENPWWAFISTIFRVFDYFHVTRSALLRGQNKTNSIPFIVMSHPSKGNQDTGCDVFLLPFILT